VDVDPTRVQAVELRDLGTVLEGSHVPSVALASSLGPGGSGSDPAEAAAAWNPLDMAGVLVGVEGRPPGERELVMRAQRGDARAFEELVSPHRELAFRVAYLITRNTTDAEDATQEALVRAWRGLGRFRTGAPLRPWLLRIVANEARNRNRARGRRERLVLRAAAASSGEAAPSPEETAVATARRQRLLDALEQLPEASRLVLQCRYLLDLSELETAAALGLRRGTVKSRTARALERLRETYAGRA
jgi:RNA polymerase sigma factor (sigma-70 family)